MRSGEVAANSAFLGFGRAFGEAFIKGTNLAGMRNPDSIR